VSCAAVVDEQYQRRHGPLRYCLFERLCSRLVNDCRLRLEQPELERRLLGMLDGQPAIVTVAGIRVNLKPELFDIELQRFVLIANVNTGYLDTLAHGTSASSDALISPPSSRRFSETAILRSGLCAALT